MASHLSVDERKRLSTLLEAGFSRAAVSRALVRAKSTITRELARNRRRWCTVPARLRSEPSAAAASADCGAIWIVNVAQRLNHRPRKILNYLTPSEIFTRNNVAIET